MSSFFFFFFFMSSPETDQKKRLLKTTSGQETILSSVEYAIEVLDQVVSSTPWLAIRARLAQLSGSRTTTTTSEEEKSPLLALATIISETRYNLRLLGLIPLWVYVSGTIKSPPVDPVERNVTRLQLASILVYQALENLAYLGTKGVVSKQFLQDKFGGVGRVFIWSTRGWFAFICLAFVKLARQYVLRQRKYAEKNDNQDEKREEVRAWKKSLVGNLLWAPLALHWSLEKGLGIPKPLMSPTMLAAGAWDLFDSWNVTSLQ